MQEDLERQSLTLIVRATKLTGHGFMTAIKKFLAWRKNKKLNVVHHRGKQTVKQLVAQDRGASSMEINDPDIKKFEKIARKYGVDFAIKKDKSCKPPKYLLFFKGQDADAITAAFEEYTQKKIKQKQRPSVIKTLCRLSATLKKETKSHSHAKEKVQQR